MNVTDCGYVQFVFLSKHEPVKTGSYACVCECLPIQNSTERA